MSFQNFSDTTNSNQESGCAYSFNQTTSRERISDNGDHLKYIFDFKPQNACMGRNQQFQGLSNKQPPSNLIDVENYLQRNPLILEDARFASTTVNQSNFSNTMLVQDCQVDNSFETTRISRIDRPIYGNPVYEKGRYQTDIMAPGRNTRQEVKDNYKPPNTSYTIIAPKSMVPTPKRNFNPTEGKPYISERYPCKTTYEYNGCGSSSMGSSCSTPLKPAFNKNKPQYNGNGNYKIPTDLNCN